MEQAIQYGWSQAQHHRFTEECCVRSYLDLSCLLGCDFAVDAMLPWAAKILNDSHGTHEIEHGDLLHEAAWDYTRKVAGDYRNVAASRLSHQPDGPLAAKETPAVVQLLKRQLREIFPAKCSYVNDEIWESVITRSVQSAFGHGITTFSGVAQFALVRLSLGLSFDRDPFLPWTAQALNDQTVADPNRRIEMLYQNVQAFVRRWWNLPSAEGGR